MATFLHFPFLIWSNYAAIVDLGGFSIGVAVFSPNRLSPMNEKPLFKISRGISAIETCPGGKRRFPYSNTIRRRKLQLHHNVHMSNALIKLNLKTQKKVFSYHVGMSFVYGTIRKIFIEC